jgi:hypothetical protein
MVDEAEVEDGDAELGWANEGSQSRLHGDRLDREPTLGARETTYGTSSASWQSDRTVVHLNEDGGDIQDEPHDDDDPLEANGDEHDFNGAEEGAGWPVIPDLFAIRQAGEHAGDALRELLKRRGRPVRERDDTVVVIDPKGVPCRVTRL